MFNSGLTITKAVHSNLRRFTEGFLGFIEIFIICYIVFCPFCVPVYECVCACVCVCELVCKNTLYENTISGHLYLLIFECVCVCVCKVGITLYGRQAHIS